MKPDPIMAEVYRAKEQFAREVGYDIGKLFERLREDAKKHPERMAQTRAQTRHPPGCALKKSGRGDILTP